MSRTPIWCEIVCRECATRSDGQFTSAALPRRALEKYARQAGWQLKHNEAFCSLRCLGKFEAAQPLPGGEKQ